MALAPHIAKLNIPVDEAQLGAFVASKPTVEQLRAFATQALNAAGKSEEELAEVLAVIDQLVKKGTPEGVHLIEDVKQFRATAERAPYATPVAEVSLFPHLIPTVTDTPLRQYSDLIAKV